MKLSIVIVNYNVKHFLQQCLFSVFNAIQKTEAEVWLVDNNSVDGSVQMVKKLFPQVKLIENKENVGFSKANNQAIKESTGKYVLLLNPDTIVEETTFEKIVDFMDKHENAGALGVKMIDGKGNFLPESKRGIPTPKVAFYKMTGLTKFFPKSKKFAKYYMGNLSPDQTNKVEILSGAFMLLRKTVLDKIGLLDETFFMYGEDIDLSYRILQEGYENYYFADTKIVHYKGESTKKGSLNYVYVFYNAMIIFAQKHFAKKKAKLFMYLIKLAIFLRAGLSATRRIFSKISLPFIDLGIILGGFFLFVPLWEKYHLNAITYPYFIWYMLPTYAIIWLLTSFFYGAYDEPIKLKSVFSGVTIGTIIILVIYALIDTKYRFSRAIILIGAAYAIISMYSIRLIFNIFKNKNTNFLYSDRKNKIFIVGEIDEAKRVSEILKQISTNINILGFISPNGTESEDYIGDIKQIDEIIKIFKADEVIFCSKNLSSEHIISRMLQLSDLNIKVKIAPEDSFSIIGSNSINLVEDMYTVDINSILSQSNRRLKIIFDLIFSLILLFTFPITMFLVESKTGFIKNIFRVLSLKKSWVGFYKSNFSVRKNKQKIKSGILSFADTFSSLEFLNEKIIYNLNISYAKDYKISSDIQIVLKAFKKLGQ